MNITTAILIMIMVLAFFGDAPLKQFSPWVNVLVGIAAFVILIVSLVR